jgi:hypothetical protein
LPGDGGLDLPLTARQPIAAAYIAGEWVGDEHRAVLAVTFGDRAS